MSGLPEIASLWIGPRLSWLEQLCLKSFADAGHRVTLYSYQPIENVPDGVRNGDAAEIYREEPMLRHARTGSPAIHADMWRLHLLAKTDAIWVDADMYCHRPFDFAHPWVFGWEKPGLVCNAVLGLPKTSATLTGLLAFFEDEYAIAPWLKKWQRRELEAARDAGKPVHMTEQNWGFTGPASVTWFLQETGEIAHARPEAAFYPVSFKDRNHMIQSKFDIDERLGEETFGVHFWARRMKPRLEEKENNRPRRGSYMDRLIAKHQIDPDAAPIPAKPKPPAEVICSQGIKVPIVEGVVTPKIEKPLRNGRYEGGECAALRAHARPGDRVLELGAGMGMTSTVAGLIPGVEAVTTVEANPEMIPIIEETHRLNRVTNVQVINGVVSPAPAGDVTFYLRADFWAASMEPDSRPYTKAVPVPSAGIAELLATSRPTVIVADIEGAELGLFDDVDLSGVRVVVLELHPKVYGGDQADAICALLDSKGLRPVPVDRPTTVRSFVRKGPPATPVAWPPKDPRSVIVTCMKDEGPFIIEWLAWHQAIGITDVVVYTNGCTDGTDRMLDHLEAMGHVRHLPNPALATGRTNFQPTALRAATDLPELVGAAFFISMDVDEFINVRTGSGHLTDLLAATGPFDALSISEINHGNNRQEAFVPGLVTEQFPAHESETPDGKRARRGVKTLVRLSPKVDALRNHRPDFRPDAADVTWIDGSGRPLASLRDDHKENGIDVRGTYDLVALDHYPLRSLESFMVKMFRGDVVVPEKQASRRYWRVRNANTDTTSSLARQQPRFRERLAALMADDTLRTLQEDCNTQHAARAKSLMTLDTYQERRAWILDNAW